MTDAQIEAKARVVVEDLIAEAWTLPENKRRKHIADMKAWAAHVLADPEAPRHKKITAELLRRRGTDPPLDIKRLERIADEVAAAQKARSVVHHVGRCI